MNVSIRAKFLARVKAEIGRRSKVVADRFSKFKDDPVGFVELGLLGFLWSKQKTIMESVRDNRRTAVPSCHDVGKSKLAAYVAAWWISCHPPGQAFVVTLAPTAHQVKAILWRELNRIHADGRLIGQMTQTEWKIGIGDNLQLVAFGRSPNDNDPTSLQGIHELYVLVIFDEACGIAKALCDAADTLVANEFSRMLAIGNPDDPSAEFASMCKPGSGWAVHPISAFDSPNFTGEKVPEWLKPLLVSKIWVAERAKKWGIGSPLYLSKVLGKFPEQSKDGLVPLGDIAAATLRDLEPGLPCELGVDVARYGDNFTVIYLRKGPVAKRLVRYQGKDTMVTVGHIMQALREYPEITRVKIDDTGVGGGVTDRLNELAREEETRDLLRTVEIVGVNVGQAPTVLPENPTARKEQRYSETEQFFNLRAQLNWAMRLRFQTGDIDLSCDEDNDDLLAQAGDIRYRLTSRGQIQIETKDEMTKRGRPSPDDWDALVLAFADDIGSAPLVITDDILRKAALSGVRRR